MDTKAQIYAIIGAAVTLAGLQIGLFTWLKSDISALSDRLVKIEIQVTRVESDVGSVQTTISGLDERLQGVKRQVGRVGNEVSYVKGQLSLVLPAVAQAERRRADTTE